jgi:uncharacterized protein YeaO (DUF488 family)
MAISIVRLGSARRENEGIRIGTVRRPPRGVAKDRYAAEDYFDVWFPNLAPSEELLRAAKAEQAVDDDKAWRAFARRFLAEMKAPGPKRDLDLLAALSHRTDLAIGCYCEDEAHCHRSILRDLLLRLGADIRS